MTVLTLVDNRLWIGLGVLAYLIVAVLVALVISSVISIRDDQVPPRIQDDERDTR